MALHAAQHAKWGSLVFALFGLLLATLLIAKMQGGEQHVQFEWQSLVADLSDAAVQASPPRSAKDSQPFETLLGASVPPTRLVPATLTPECEVAIGQFGHEMQSQSCTADEQLRATLLLGLAQPNLAELCRTPCIRRLMVSLRSTVAAACGLSSSTLYIGKLLAACADELPQFPPLLTPDPTQLPTASLTWSPTAPPTPKLELFPPRLASTSKQDSSSGGSVPLIQPRVPLAFRKDLAKGKAASGRDVPDGSPVRNDRDEPPASAGSDEQAGDADDDQHAMTDGPPLPARASPQLGTAQPTPQDAGCGLASGLGLPCGRGARPLASIASIMFTALLTLSISRVW